MEVLRRAIVVLKLTGLPVPLLITLTTAILAAMTGNTFFPTPDPALAVVKASLDALIEAEGLAKGGGASDTAARNEAKNVVLGHLYNLKAFVQKAADANRVQAVQIILSAGMRVKQVGERVKEAIKAKRGSSAGIANLFAKAIKGAGSYEWQMSTDEKNWVLLPSTKHCHTTVAGLTVGTAYYFRVRGVVAGPPSEFIRCKAYVAT